ncbi:hypothetical protein PHYSODRAFT_325943 [Phytophthora sojae]|uniref:Uncharacterized protein n=1 Tax=Phytophthora sojae (strain P6497) TaxID=1094619 RepID=G4YUI7_PHYSP|nr:hypothetical protein PHYSODRAFT_325943 [Phytophthora sojae]EGZ24879.1 hypothetical protein PHYSODRAFT_325943 [Phytophthora sojae]|eukprot:XP_009520167.1 hypothetical protein PHYSODRAFT_325943 [Phytophthora sojae]
MSSTAVANGGGVAAGGLVATLQSVGAAGLAFSTGGLFVGVPLAAGLGYAFATAAAPVVAGTSVVTIVGSGAGVGATISGLKEYFRPEERIWVLAEKFTDSNEKFQGFNDEESATAAYDESSAPKKILLLHHVGSGREAIELRRQDEGVTK